MYLVDTNILIYHFNGSIPDTAKERLEQIFLEQFNISVITKMEFLGFRRHTDESYHKAVQFVSFANCIGLDEQVVEKVVELRRNFSVKLPDAIIAATALVGKLCLVTRNTSDFAGMDVDIFNPFDV